MILRPILLLIAVLVRINLGSSVIFKYKHPGKDGKIFRTMTKKRDEKGNLLPNGERLVGFGRFLRSTNYLGILTN